MEPTLLVIGLNHRTAPMAMRERFWISENRRYEALRELGQAEGIDEVVILANNNRTEFFLWAGEPTLAANSLLHFLTLQHGLRLSEWEHFYRLLDEAALIHIFRVVSGLDAMALGESQIIAELKAAREQARSVGTSGRFLNAILDKAVSIAQQAHRVSVAAKVTGLIPQVAVEISRETFDSIESRPVLLLGADEISELAVRSLVENGAAPVCVIDPSLERAQALAQELGGNASSLEERWQRILEADIVICATECTHTILSRQEAERIAIERKGAPLVILDIAMPRNVDPDVRRVDGILLCDLDSMERIAKRKAADRAVAAESEKLVLAEAQAFRNQLLAESVVPTVVALRRRLNEICRQELESFTEERGPFTREQDQALHAITAQVIQKIAGSLAQELKGLPEEAEQKQMTAAVRRLFHLETPQPALAGATSERNNYEQHSNRVVTTH